jgi:xanthine dehydrogenase small subunit
MRNKITFYLNGKRQDVGPAQASMMLAEYLRYEQGLTGTKIVCAEGDCGACSVLRYFPHVEGTDTKNYLPINSCISMVAQLDGSSLVTVDALKQDGKLHEAQRAMVDCHGSQCGFCTPGFVVALTGLVEEKLSRQEVTITPQEAKNCMTGNLCRCTGYRPIIDAALDIKLADCQGLKERFYSREQKEVLDWAFEESVLVEDEHFVYFAPKSIKEALSFLHDHPDTRIVGSATDLGVVHNKRRLKLVRLLSLHQVSELYTIREHEGVISLGARVTLTEFRHFLKDRIPEFANYIDVFASPQIKNMATVVGNVANASPIGDTPPALLALNARVEVIGPKGKHEIPLSEFFLAYRKVKLTPGEVITGLKFPLPEKNTTLRFFKNANRKDLDISAVNLAIRVDWKDEQKSGIKDIMIAGGGVAATPLRFKLTEESLKRGDKIEDALKVMHTEFSPLSDLRASSAYRRVLVENFMRRFFAEAGGVQ